MLSHVLSLDPNPYSQFPRCTAAFFISPCYCPEKRWIVQNVAFLKTPVLLTLILYQKITTLVKSCFLNLFLILFTLIPGKGDDAHLSFPGDRGLFRIPVLFEGGQQEEAADPVRSCVQSTLRFRTQEICHRGCSKDICLRCCFYPGCLTSKGWCECVLVL